MSNFPIRYDADAGIIYLDGEGGRHIMLTFLLKLKFGERYDPIILFHSYLADIMVALAAKGSHKISDISGVLNRETLCRIADEIVGNSADISWWKLTRDQQIEFVQNVVVAPFRLSDDEIDLLFGEIDAGLSRRRHIVEAADAAKTA